MYERVTHRISRASMAFLLAFTICAYPFVCAKKAEAIAPVVGAGAAAAALAAELGITTEALMTGLMVITAAGTGVYLMNSSDYSSSAVSLNDTQWRNLWDGTDLGSGYEGNWAPEYQKWKLGNGKSWEDLTPEERQNWSSPAEYDQSQLLGYALETGLISEIAGGGGYEPTPEPDPNTDPEGHERWQKSRNVLTVLGVGGAAVALNDAVSWLGDTVGNGIHDLVFGSQGMNLTHTISVPYGNENINFFSAGPWSYNGTTYPASNWSAVIRWSNLDIDDPNTRPGYGYAYYIKRDGSMISNVVDISHPGNWVINLNGRGTRLDVELNGTVNGIIDNSSDTTKTCNSAAKFGLNLNFTGTYRLPDGAQISNGAWIVEPQNGYDLDYDAMNGTPNGLSDSVGNNSAWPVYIDTASQPDANGMVNAVTVPAVLSDGLTYGDIVKPTLQDDVTPIPDDQPVTPPQPEPEPGLSPNAPEGFEDDLGESVERILRNPFDQVFPFCLIADFRDFIYLFLAGDTELGQNTQRLRPQSLTVQSDVSTDELNGVHSIKLDLDESFEGFEVDIPLDPVHDLLAYSRIPLTVLFALALVYESFSFFLKRGGE